MRHLDRRHTLYGRGQLLDDAEIVRLYAELKDAELVGMRAGVSGTTVLNRVRAAGGKVHPPGHTRGQTRRQPTLTTEEICALYRDGMSGTRIAERAGCSVRHVYNTLEASGIPRRNRLHRYGPTDL